MEADQTNSQVLETNVIKLNKEVYPMQVEVSIENDLVFTWTFTGDIDQDEVYAIIDADTEAMEECGYENTFEDETFIQEGTNVTLEVTQIWSKEGMPD